MPSSSPDPRVTRLPGVGTRLEIRDTAGTAVHVVLRNDGRVELHHPGGSHLELDEANAHALGAFVTNHYLMTPEVVERLDDVMGGLLIDWVTLPASAVAVGHSIEELEIRKRTRVTIVAILRGAVPIVAPEPSIRLEARDDLVIACREHDREGFVRYLTGGR